MITYLTMLLVFSSCIQTGVIKKSEAETVAAPTANTNNSDDSTVTTTAPIVENTETEEVETPAAPAFELDTDAIEFYGDSNVERATVELISSRIFGAYPYVAALDLDVDGEISAEETNTFLHSWNLMGFDHQGDFYKYLGAEDFETNDDGAITLDSEFSDFLGHYQAVLNALFY